MHVGRLNVQPHVTVVSKANEQYTKKIFGYSVYIGLTF
jgi:predicted metal-dependent TIM-barrel fold hydrolase